MIEHVRDALRPFHAENRILEFPVSSATVELAAMAVGCEPARIAKTLSFMVKDQPILIVMAGDSRLNNKKYKERFGTKAKMMTADELLQFTGLSFGGVCPFGISGNVDIYLDHSLKRFETVYPACGTSNSAIEVTLQELALFSNAKDWFDISTLPEEA